MREIIHLQIGDCGNAIGKAHWSNIFLDYPFINGKNSANNFSIIQEKIGVYLEEKSNQNYTARNIAVHTENDSLNPYFSPDDFVKIESAGNNWGKGYYGSEVDEYIIDLAKSKTEACDSLQGFEISHSLGGGSGSGLTSRVIEMLKDEFPEILICMHTIFPYSGMGDCLVEPYNVTLSFPYLHMPKNVIFAIQNERLFNFIFHQKHRIPSFYADFNHIAAAVLSGITSSFRYSGTLNGDLQKLVSNLTPIETMNFLIPEYTELSSLWLHDTLSRIFRDGVSANLLCNVDKNQKYIAAACNFRGCEDYNKEINSFFDSDTNEIINNMPKKKIKYSVIEANPNNFPMQAVSIINSTGFRKTLMGYLEQYYALKRRNAFLHHFYGEGVEDDDFTQSANEMRDLIETYENVYNSL
ncbi:unnamed protein product [Blepharisma stoltei]|uniref:Tubulin beta chain n=1 Tax=Blepharisma stoltei TaxID=1481888 RepID=A0AAU9JQF9_9CILI|nr:unnamed protein product [Blepharisma stoltei]